MADKIIGLRPDGALNPETIAAVKEIAGTGTGSVVVTDDGAGTYTVGGTTIKGLTTQGQLPGPAKKYVDDGLAGKANTTHTHTWAEVTGKPATFTPATHTHDDRYYTEAEVDAKLSTKASTANKWKGGNISAWSTLTLAEHLAEAERLNLNTITVPVRVDAVNLNDSAPALNTADFNTKKPIIEGLVRAGFHVIVEPYPFIADGNSGETGWNPSNMAAWFTNWGNACKTIAAHAQTAGAHAMYLASNLVYMEYETARWDTLITQIRAIFTGKIAIRTNFWVTATWDEPSTTAYQNKLNNPIWGMVDIIAIAAYFELTNTVSPSKEELRAAIYDVPIYDRGQNIFAEIEALANRWNKPIYFGELGIPPWDGMADQPYDYIQGTQAEDQQLQADWFDVWYDEFGGQDWFLGYSIYNIGDRTSVYDVTGNLAEPVIAAHTFQGAVTPVTPHTHSYTALTDVPTSFTPTNHSHAADNITTGTLAPARLPAATSSAQGAMPAVDKSKLDSAVSAATASRLVIRDTAGRAQFATPSATADAATKGYVDTGLTGKADATHRHTWDQIDGKPATVAGGSSAKPVLASLLALPRYKDQVTDDKPTFTVGTTNTMGTNGAVTSYLSTYQPAGRQVPTEGCMHEGLAPMEFVFNGSELQIRFQAINWGAFTTQVWVDNKPVSVDPVVNTSITPPSTIGYIYLKWAAARSRRIRVMNRGGAIQELRVGNPKDQVMPVADTPLLGLVVDSFGGATDYANDTQTLTEWLSRSLNANVMVSTVGGSGYLTGGQLNQKYSDGARQYLIRAAKLDAILFFGSINDPFQETEDVTRKAFRDTWDAYAAANPTAPIVVFGVQPAGAETTVGMPVHRNNRLMYLEAMAHPRVIGFVDMLGTAKGSGAAPTAWAAGTQYNSASVVAYNGAVYGATVEAPTTFTNATPPASSPYWRQISWIFNGTGNTGNLKNDGNRDYLIGADGTHPMPAAGYAFGQLMASAVLRVMASGSSFTYFNV